MIDKLIEQQEIIKGMQENQDSAIKIMKMYEDYKLRVDKAIEYIKKLKTYPYLTKYYIKDLENILKGDDKE